MVTASFHILKTDSVGWLISQLLPKRGDFARHDAYPLIGLLNSLSSDEIDAEISAEAIEAVWFYLDIVCDLKLHALSVLTPASNLAALGYRFIYSVPYSIAKNIFDQTDGLTIEDRQMRFLLSEMHESDGNFDRFVINRALVLVRNALNKIGPEQLGVLWLRND